LNRRKVKQWERERANNNNLVYIWLQLTKMDGGKTKTPVISCTSRNLARSIWQSCSCRQAKFVGPSYRHFEINGYQNNKSQFKNVFI
jgi:hypothetical protein